MKFNDVLTFHDKFEIPGPRVPTLLTKDEFEFRTKAIGEELDEFIFAHNIGSMVGCADALADLIWFAMGTAVMMGIPLEAVWACVKKANMTKELANEPTRSKRGYAKDVIKPEDWIGPEIEIAAILSEAGYIKDEGMLA